jgi:large subunit ribosomal protein L10
MRREKEPFVLDIREKLLNSSIVVVVNRSPGITVEEITKLRKDMFETEANFKVLKNTLARIAIKDSELECIKEHFEGPTGLAYSNNPVGMAKVLAKFADDSEKMTILGGIMDGKTISGSVVKALASLPSQDELRAKIARLLTTNIVKIIRTIKEPSSRVARVIAAKI